MLCLSIFLNRGAEFRRSKTWLSQSLIILNFEMARGNQRHQKNLIFTMLTFNSCSIKRHGFPVREAVRVWISFRADLYVGYYTLCRVSVVVRATQPYRLSVSSTKVKNLQVLPVYYLYTLKYICLNLQYIIWI